MSILNTEVQSHGSSALVEDCQPIIARMNKTDSEIFNHIAPRLSELDLRMVKSVPEGGNWKNIPRSIPSKRLEQIRESFKRGEGSRSTYYGRLRSCDPSYTINTYFNRPGNGCHIHYEQDRVLSPREAARLQSFPDSFEFLGSQGAISTQIGNAVPPLLAYQLAGSLGAPGVFIDLFSGAGGMGLGFKWAGGSPIIANDIHATYLSTYAKNVHNNIIAGSISDAEVIEKLLDAAKRATLDGRPFWVLGGPPCQGFSTAGNQRTMKDQRNHLVWDYVRFLAEARPDGFVFENVTGLLNMERGGVFKAVQEAFSSIVTVVNWEVLSSEQYGIPQRRKRVFLVGTKEALRWHPPIPVTCFRSKDVLFDYLPNAISAQDALDDLPALMPAQDGRGLPYRYSPKSTYQEFMRGMISAAEYLYSISK